jgi:quinol monooxygenase YgiN
MAFVLVVHLRIAEGNEKRALGIIEELTNATRAEPGCELYIPCREEDDPRSLIIYEQYRDRAAFDEHGASEHFERLARNELWPLLESRERTFYETAVD